MPEREYPEPTAAPCNECPWRRVAVAGYLGPYTALDWVKIAHGESAIACHKTIDSNKAGESWDQEGLRQCRGAAIFRANGFKEPHNESIATGPQDCDTVFHDGIEFIRHHTGEEPRLPIDIYSALSTEGGEEEFSDPAD